MARKISDCCNPSAKRNEDRCIGCPMRTPEVRPDPKASAATTAPKAATQPSAPPTPPAPAKPEPRKSLWAFLNGDIPRGDE